MDLIDRKTAHGAGMTLFFTGKPCKHGHVAPRYVITGNCQECNRTMRPLRKRSDARIMAVAAGQSPTDVLSINVRVPRRWVAALKELAAAWCALEGVGHHVGPRPAPTPGTGGPRREV